MRVVIEMEQLLNLFESEIKTENEYFSLFSDYEKYLEFVRDLDKFYSNMTKNYE